VGIISKSLWLSVVLWIFFCSSRPPGSLSCGADLGGDLEVSVRRRSVSFVLLEGEGFVDFVPEVL